MKKLLVIFVMVVFVSCSPDQLESNNIQETKTTALSVLDGNMISFKDEKSFIQEYSALTEMKTKEELQNWILKKGHLSLLNTSYEDEKLQDSIISNNRIIYSDALKAILNKDSKFKVGGKVIWLNVDNFYILSAKDYGIKAQDLILMKNDLEIYGNLLNTSKLNKSNTTSFNNRNILPNENRSKTYIVELPDGKRYILDLYNETIIINNQISSSKMFLRITPQYRSCSFWRCTWKTDGSKEWRLLTNLSTSNVMWKIQNYNTHNNLPFYGQRTFLIANWEIKPPFAINYQNFNVTGKVKIIDPIVGTSGNFETELSWY